MGAIQMPFLEFAAAVNAGTFTAKEGAFTAYSVFILPWNNGKPSDPYVCWITEIFEDWGK